MMKALTLSVAASVLALGLAATPSSATPAQPSTFTFGSGTNSANFSGITSKKFQDSFTLILLAGGDTSVHFDSSFTGAQQNTKFNSFELTNGTDSYFSNDITYTTGFDKKGNKINTGVSGSIFASDLAIGTFSLILSGTDTQPTNYAGTISVSSVPLPPALPLFGAALLGLGAVGYSSRRKGVQSSLVAAS